MDEASADNGERTDQDGAARADTDRRIGGAESWSALKFPSPAEMQLIYSQLLDAAERFKEAVHVFNSFAPAIEQFRASLPHIVNMQKLAQKGRECDAATAAGILPHSLIPWGKLDLQMEPLELRARICEVVEENWGEISNQLKQRLGDYAVNEETKSVFREAVAAHDAHLYRACVRLVMPELERMVRVHLGDGRVDDTSIAKEFLGIVRKLPVGVLLRIDRGLDIYKRIEDHIYADVRTPERVKAFTEDPIPTRHAAVHGLISYDRFENSLNAIFMLDFMMELIGFSLPYFVSEGLVERESEAS